MRRGELGRLGVWEEGLGFIMAGVGEGEGLEVMVCFL